MREILFRGKRKDNGECVEGYLVIADERYFIAKCPECITSLYYPDDIYSFTGFVEVIPETVGQFTGLTAKNGKIFEGDIIKNSINWKCRVEYAEARFYPFVAYPDFCSWNAEECEVIGNIHDNPSF